MAEYTGTGDYEPTPLTSTAQECPPHMWNRWGEPKMITYYQSDSGLWTNRLVQFRTCVKCGLAESQEVRRG